MGRDLSSNKHNETPLGVFKDIGSANKQYFWRKIQMLYGSPHKRKKFRNIHSNDHHYFESFASSQIHEQRYNRYRNGEK